MTGSRRVARVWPRATMTEEGEDRRKDHRRGEQHAFTAEPVGAEHQRGQEGRELRADERAADRLPHRASDLRSDWLWP